MRFKEYGSGRDTIILLHGGGLSWWNYREAAELLQGNFRVILPILDGHAGSDRHFTTIEDNAAEIIEFIDDTLGGSVWLIGGLSLGGQVALEILSRRGDICRRAVIESASVIPSPVISAAIKPTILCSYPLIKNERFARVQFDSLKMKRELFTDYYRDTCSITAGDMTAFLKASTSYSLKPSIRDCSAEVSVFFGEKETRGIKRSAGLIGNAIPNCTVKGLKGLHHGEFPMAHAGSFAAVLSGRKK